MGGGGIEGEREQFMKTKKKEEGMEEFSKKVAVAVTEKGLASPLSLESVKPEVAMEMIVMFSRGYSRTRVHRETGVHLETAEKVMMAHKDLIKEGREMLAAKMMMLQVRTAELMHRKIDRMLEDESQIDKTNIRDFAQATSMMGESYLNAVGEGPKVGVTVQIGPTFEDVQKHLEMIRAKIAGAAGAAGAGKEMKVAEPPITDI